MVIKTQPADPLVFPPWGGAGGSGGAAGGGQQQLCAPVTGTRLWLGVLSGCACLVCSKMKDLLFM